MSWGPEQKFFQRRYTDGQQIHEKMLTLINIREKQIKTNIKYYLIPIRITLNNKKKTMNKCCLGCGEKCTHAFLVALQIGVVTMENSIELPKIFKIQLLYNPAISLLGIYMNKTKILIENIYICSHVYYSIIYIAKMWKQYKCPLIDE